MVTDGYGWLLNVITGYGRLLSVINGVTDAGYYGWLWMVVDEHYHRWLLSVINWLRMVMDGY